MSGVGDAAGSHVRANVDVDAQGLPDRCGLALGVPVARLRATESARKPRHIGIVPVAGMDPKDLPAEWSAFDAELRARGWVEGENLAVERRESSGDRSQLPGLMAELVALDVEVICVYNAWSALAAKEATDRIPIVFMVGDAAGRGLVTNFARPERNLTGTSVAVRRSSGQESRAAEARVPATSESPSYNTRSSGIHRRCFRAPTSRAVSRSSSSSSRTVTTSSGHGQGFRTEGRCHPGGAELAAPDAERDCRDGRKAASALDLSRSEPPSSWVGCFRLARMVPRTHASRSRTSTRSSAAPSRLICPSNSHLRSTWRSTSGRRRRSGSAFRRNCWCTPTW